MLLIPPCPPRLSRPSAMASTSSSTQHVPATRTYDDALKALGGLISGKKRPDGSSWAHVFESMQLHLDVCGGIIDSTSLICSFLDNLASQPPSSAIAAHRPPSPPQRGACCWNQGQGTHLHVPCPTLNNTCRAPHVRLSRACSAAVATQLDCTPHHTCVTFENASASTGGYPVSSFFANLQRRPAHSVPIDQDRFLKHFWMVYDTLQSKSDQQLGMPAYFRFLTLLGASMALINDSTWVQ